MSINYVKFQRGSLAAYEALKTAGRLDSNTLYFIKSNNGVGRLYMGENLISGGDVVLQSAKLDDLEDVLVFGAKTGDFLVYNEEGKWVPKSAANVAKEIFEALKLDETLALNEEGALGIAGFNAAENGSQLMKNDAGDLVWIKPSTETVEGLQTTVAGLQSSVESLDADIEEVAGNVTSLEGRADAIEDVLADIEAEIGNPAEGDSPATGLYKSIDEVNAAIANIYTKEEVESYVTEAIANAGHLKRALVDELPEIASADTNTIYMVPKADGADPDVRNEFIVVNGKWEKIGDTAVKLDGYATEDYVDNAIKDKANAEDVYSKDSIDGLLANKVDAIEGYSLLSPEQAATIELIEQGKYDNYISSVNEEIFEVVDGELNLAAIPAELLIPILGDISILKNIEEEPINVVGAIQELQDFLTWKEIPEINI